MPDPAYKPAVSFRRLAPLALAGLSFFAGPGAGAADLYAGFSFGGNVSPSVTLVSRSDDRASICDEFINPRALSIPACTAPGRGAGDGWLAPFDGGSGLSAGAQIGARLSPRYRIAALYGYNATHFDQTVSSTDATGADFDKISNELAVGEETLGAATSHALFLAAFRDWPNGSRWTPYAGIGVGVVWARKDFSYLWSRSPDPADISTGAGQPNVEEIRRNLAGTASVGRTVLRDTLTGYFLDVGMDRALSDGLSMGLSLRWTNSGEFESDAYQGDLLRSHEPNLRLDGSEPVSAWSSTEDTGRLVVMLSLRFSLPR